MYDIISEIQQDIRDLRDDDSHVCPYSEQQNREFETGEAEEDQECTCNKYDWVIDKLEKLKEILC